MVFIGILVGDGIGQIINCDDIRAMFVRRLDGRQQIADASQQHDFLHKVKDHSPSYSQKRNEGRDDKISGLGVLSSSHTRSA